MTMLKEMWLLDMPPLEAPARSSMIRPLYDKVTLVTISFCTFIENGSVHVTHLLADAINAGVKSAVESN